MDRVDQVAAGLLRAGEPGRIERAEIPELTDDSVVLSGGLHVQVGESCMILVRENRDGTSTFFPEADSLAHLLQKIRDARAESASASAEDGGNPSWTPADASTHPGATEGETAPVALPFAADHLPTRDTFTAGGGVLHRSPVDGADYALLAPLETRRCHSVLRFDETGKPAVVAESNTQAGAAELLTGYLDGTHQASADRYFAWLEERAAAVRPDVAGPLRAAGYEIYNTGGNCLAWMRDLSGTATDSYILISTDPGIDGDSAAAEWLVGRWDSDGWINIEEGFTLAAAIRAAELLPPAIGRDGEPVEEVYPTLAAALADLADAARANDG